MKKPETRFYRHYKNKPYKLLGTARHSETLEELACYESLYSNPLGTLWVRPKEMFFEEVLIDGKKRPRFEKVEFNFLHFEHLTDSQWSEIAEIFESAFLEKFDISTAKKKVDCYRKIHAIICYDGQRPVGFKVGYANGEDKFYSWLGGVSADHQKLGIASSMMYEMLTWAKQSDFRFVETKTMSKYREMISLNLKWGFEIVGTEFESGSKLKVLMEKKL